MAAMMWGVSLAFLGILSVIGFSGSGLVFLLVVSNTNMYSYMTQATSRWSKQAIEFLLCTHEYWQPSHMDGSGKRDVKSSVISTRHFKQ